MEENVARLEKVKLELGDVLVVRFQKMASMQDIDRLHQYFKTIFPHNEAIFIQPDAELEVIIPA